MNEMNSEPVASCPLPAAGSTWSHQDENGIDLLHLRSNRRLTVTERFERHQQALETMMEVARAAHAAGLRRNP